LSAAQTGKATSAESTRLPNNFFMISYLLEVSRNISHPNPVG
jgi:hypothetical protein